MKISKELVFHEKFVKRPVHSIWEGILVLPVPYIDSVNHVMQFRQYSRQLKVFLLHHNQKRLAKEELLVFGGLQELVMVLGVVFGLASLDGTAGAELVDPVTAVYNVVVSALMAWEFVA